MVMIFFSYFAFIYELAIFDRVYVSTSLFSNDKQHLE